jgi:DNA-directed RNA polymerase alpha subunit
MWREKVAEHMTHIPKNIKEYNLKVKHILRIENTDLYKEIGIEILLFDKYLYNSVARGGMETIQDILELTFMDLCNMPNFGGGALYKMLWTLRNIRDNLEEENK